MPEGFRDRYFDLSWALYGSHLKHLHTFPVCFPEKIPKSNFYDNFFMHSSQRRGNLDSYIILLSPATARGLLARK